jgi:hypothetical protein
MFDEVFSLIVKEGKVMRKLGSLLVVLSLGLFMVGCSGDKSATPASSAPPAAGGEADSGATGTTTPAEPAAGSETNTDGGGSTDAGS